MSPKKTKGPALTMKGAVESPLTNAFATALEKAFGHNLTVRTLTYILKRIEKSGYSEKPQIVFQKIFTKGRLQEFRTIFRKILNREPFEDEAKRNIDAINAINFALSDEAQGKRVAKEGLRSILKWKTKNAK